MADALIRTRVAVACEANASGQPDWFLADLIVTAEQFDAGEHYDLAINEAREAGYEEDMVAFDEQDDPGLIEYIGHQLAPNPIAVAYIAPDVVQHEVNRLAKVRRRTSNQQQLLTAFQTALTPPARLEPDPS